MAQQAIKDSDPILDYSAGQAVDIFNTPFPLQEPISPADIEKVAQELLKHPQIEMPVQHHFAPGVYTREIFMPAGIFVIGHRHKTEHLNVVLSGRATVYYEGVVEEIKAPYIFKSGVDAQKVLFIHEDMRWATIHPTQETDLQVLEEMLIDKSAPALEFEQSQKLPGGES
jgi:hypothetical protein